MPVLNLTSAFRHHLLMIVKEALHNVVSHSEASVVTLDIQVENDRLLLELADNGRGMPSADQLKPGNGLQNMRKRAETLGGTCEVLKPAKASGTLIRLNLALKSAR
jgi:signal transduction histidine kinase